jgi:hypothetical protein
MHHVELDIQGKQMQQEHLKQQSSQQQLALTQLQDEISSLRLIQSQLHQQVRIQEQNKSRMISLMKVKEQQLQALQDSRISSESDGSEDLAMKKPLPFVAEEQVVSAFISSSFDDRIVIVNNEIVLDKYPIEGNETKQKAEEEMFFGFETNEKNTANDSSLILTAEKSCSPEEISPQTEEELQKKKRMKKLQRKYKQIEVVMDDVSDLYAGGSLLEDESAIVFKGTKISTSGLFCNVWFV